MQAFDVTYFTASCDDVDKLAEFAESLGLDYPILSDASRQVAQAYGVVSATQKNPKRSTFYIGLDGKLLYIDRQVKAANHGADIAAKLAELGVAKK